jgi:hypothetical protein
LLEVNAVRSPLNEDAVRLERDTGLAIDRVSVNVQSRSAAAWAAGVTARLASAHSK